MPHNVRCDRSEGPEKQLMDWPRGQKDRVPGFVTVNTCRPIADALCNTVRAPG